MSIAAIASTIAVLGVSVGGQGIVLHAAGEASDATHALLRELEAARRDSLAAMAGAVPADLRSKTVTVWVGRSTADFMRMSGGHWHHSGSTSPEGIVLQPLGVLRRHGQLAASLRHEFVHYWLQGAPLPLWLHEGLASHLAGQHIPGAPVGKLTAKSLREAEAILTLGKDRQASQQAYRQCQRAAMRLLNSVPEKHRPALLAVLVRQGLAALGSAVEVEQKLASSP